MLECLTELALPYKWAKPQGHPRSAPMLNISIHPGPLSSRLTVAARMFWRLPFGMPVHAIPTRGPAAHVDPSTARILASDAAVVGSLPTVPTCML